VAAEQRVARLLDTFAAVCYRVRRSALARWVFILLAVFSLGTTLFARPSQIENQTVRDATVNSISASYRDTYVRVTGRLDTLGIYRTSYDLGDLSQYGKQYVPLVEPGSAGAVLVADEGLPTHDPMAQVTLVALVVQGSGSNQPPLFLQVGYPPNVVIANALAHIGTTLLLVVLVLMLVAWAVERLDYAIPLPWPVNVIGQPSPAMLWFGELGRQYNDAMLRSQPAEFNATPHEARIDSRDPRGLWSVSIRRLKSAQLFEVATPYGSLPAARLRFEDERGLLRKGVIAMQSLEAREAVLRVMSLIR